MVFSSPSPLSPSFFVRTMRVVEKLLTNARLLLAGQFANGSSSVAFQFKNNDKRGSEQC